MNIMLIKAYTISLIKLHKLYHKIKYSTLESSHNTTTPYLYLPMTYICAMDFFHSLKNLYGF